jgi:hypothetical protein
MASSSGKEPPRDPPRAEPPRRSLRLTFRYDGPNVELVAAKRVAMTPPPSDPLGKQEPRSGFCLELSTQRGRVLYRRFGINPIPTSVEAPSDDPERPFQRATVQAPSGEFDVVVPELEDAVRLELMGDVAVEGEEAFAAAARPAERIASVDLRELPKARRKLS